MLNFRKVAADGDGEKIRRYLTQETPEAEPSVAIDPAGRLLEPGERLTAYYTGRDERASWRPDMPQLLSRALGIDAEQRPRDAELDRLFEARRADNGEAWTEHARKNSGFDFVFSPHKSVSLAAEFAATPAETAAIRNAIMSANDDALRYASDDLAWARKGHAGEKGADHGEIGWVTFAHDAARPTLPIQDGPNGATYLVDAPIAGDPHYHLHNFIPNLVVTEDGRIGSIDARALTADKVHEYGAYFQAKLADRLRTLGIRTGYDDAAQAVTLPDIPEAAVSLFSKRDRQVIGDAKQYARENDLDWDDLSFDRKKQLLHEASDAGRLGKTKEDARQVWRAQAAAIGWTHKTVLNSAPAPVLTATERHDAAYAYAADALSRDFQTAAVVDYEKLRVHAARGLIASGITGGREDVDRVVALMESRGIEHNGVHVALVSGVMGGRLHVTNTEQIRIEQSLSLAARRAALDNSSSLSDDQIHAAMQTVHQDDPSIRFTAEQKAAIYAIGRGSKLTLLTGVAGAGKTTLLRPVVAAWKAAGHAAVGMSTAWKQADALKEAEIEETWALQPLLNAIDTGEFQPTSSTVLVIDEISQIAPRPMLKLLELQAETGMTIKMLGDHEQVQSIEAGDTIELLRRVLPKSAMPEVLTALRQKNARDRKIAALFRDGSAEEAFEMKREDGTAHLLDGDYDQVIAKIADLYVSRTDALRAIDKNLSVTITTLTNAEAADISQAIRARLKKRGQIGADETTYQAVYYKGGDNPELFSLPIATGDKLRLYRKTMVEIDGRQRSIGNNGDIVEVLGQSDQGLHLRNAQGLAAEVPWNRLADKNTGRLLLGFGRAFTIDAAQGMSTKGEHINAMAHGTGSASAFKTYTAESRATGQTYTMISKAAVYGAVQRTLALGDATPITDEDLWRRVAKDASAKPYKALAIDLLAKAKAGREKAIDAGLGSHHRLEKTLLAKPTLGNEIKVTFEAGGARETLNRQRELLDALLQRAAAALIELTRTLADHMAGRRPTPKPSPEIPVPAPQETPAARPSSPSPGM